MDNAGTSKTASGADFDVVLVGGGLQNGLIAWMLLRRNPEARVVLVESGETLGGNHTWSFHETDVPREYQEDVAPLVEHAWDHYEVSFPLFSRTIHLGYRTLHSSHFHRMLVEAFERAPRSRLCLSTEVAEVHAGHVVTCAGDVVRGTTVIDARGPAAAFAPRASEGYQKFVGLELRLGAPSPVKTPILMDACVPQEDGFRFFYVLPLSDDRVLIEDTRFSDSPRLDQAMLQHAVLKYARENGYVVREVLRTESGVLPMPYVARSDWPRSMPLRAGYAGGLMHPATGYSFPVALRLASRVAACAPDSPLGSGWVSFIQHHQQQYRFATFLNRMLFTAYRPEHRYHIFKRFYTYPEAMIGRFYRLDMSRADMARMFVGRPPRGFSFKKIVEGALRR